MEHDLKDVKRGTDPQDNRWFSKEAILKLKKAQSEIKWLLDRNYDIHSIITFVGNHYQFSIRQRNALQRSTCSQADFEKRENKMAPFSEAKGNTLYIDGFNLIITLEVAASGGILIMCSDGTIRDLAGLRGTYSIIKSTDSALNLLSLELNYLCVHDVKFFLDSAVSNSGRLKSFIIEHLEKQNIKVQVELVPSADHVLSSMEGIVTSDSIVLNNCKSWFNLGRKIIEDYLPDANIIKLVY